MKNEREKEIEHVKPPNRYSEGFLQPRDKVRQPITDQQPQNVNVNISISRSPGELKKPGETCILHIVNCKLQIANCKEREAEEKNGIGRIK
jgi:hypothetical protein